MASISATSITFCSSLKQSVGLGTNQSGAQGSWYYPAAKNPGGDCNEQVFGRTSSVKLISVSWAKNRFPSLRSSRFRISCAAKPETVQKVCDIVRKQLALPADSELTPDSKFTALGADSLDTVEIVMELEEAFGITVEEENSQNITTVQEAADLIEDLVQKKGEA